MYRLTTAATILLVVGLPAAASAVGSISGTVRDDVGAPIAGMEVRLWAATAKGWEIAYIEITDAAGAYAHIDVADNDYLLDSRMGPGMGSQNYGDRWYDTDPPVADGWIQADADIIPITNGSTLTAYDFVMLVLCGLDGCVINGAGAPLAGMRVRVEQAGEPRIHHNDTTKVVTDGSYPGCFGMRGMVTSDDYRIIIFDPTGTYDTLVLEGPYALVPDTIDDIGQLTAPPNPVVDPYEPNDTHTDAMADSIDPAGFRQTPPVTWTSSGAFLGALPDADWFCFDAEAGDRYVVTVDSTLIVAGQPTVHPFFDPMVAWWSQSADAILTFNDDTLPGDRSSSLTVAEATEGTGLYCIIVSSYPDFDFTAASQETAGPYELTVALSNRRPAIAATVGGSATPVPPATITIAEAEPLLIDVAFSDLDGDALTVTASQVDNGALPVTEATFTLDVATATWSWVPSQSAAQGSPYVVTFAATDAELTAAVSVIIEVTGVNLAPSLPTHVDPPDALWVNSATPPMQIGNSVDVDLNTLVYEFELYLDPPPAAAVQTASVAENSSGLTSWTPTTLDENSWYSWRVRAYDGQVDNPYSAWTTPWTFFVDVQNEPPPAPQLTKPDPSLTVLVRDPTFEATNPIDPEGEAVELFFEIATDVDFTNVFVASDPVPVDAAINTSVWTPAQLLDWSTTYFARAYAVDARGGTSEYSNILTLQLRANQPPPAPAFFAPFNEGCLEGIAVELPLAPIAVINVDDPDDDPVWLTLEIYTARPGPDLSLPVSSFRIDQATTSELTRFIVDSGLLETDELYLVRIAADDDFEQSAWVDCRFIAPKPVGSASGGCDCGSTPVGLGLAAVGLSALLRRRRRR